MAERWGLDVFPLAQSVKIYELSWSSQSEVTQAKHVPLHITPNSFIKHLMNRNVCNLHQINFPSHSANLHCARNRETATSFGVCSALPLLHATRDMDKDKPGTRTTSLVWRSYLIMSLAYLKRGSCQIDRSSVASSISRAVNRRSKRREEIPQAYHSFNATPSG